MRKRLVLSLALGAVGILAAIPLGDRLGLSPTQSLIGFACAGLFLGYLLSILLDVFLAPTESENN